VAQDRPHRGDAGTSGRQEQRPAVVRAPDEIAADRPADLERVARPYVFRQVWRHLPVLEPLHGDQRRLAGGGGERVRALGAVAVLGRQPDIDVLARDVTRPLRDLELEGAYARRLVDDRRHGRDAPRQSPE